ncbi:unnamed protein product [Lepidochelys olivacea]
MLPVQDINDHREKYVRIPVSWRSKNYAFEFLENINCIVQNDLMHEIASATFHTLAVDESTNISINRYLILYFKYRSLYSADYKTSFGGLLRLQELDAVSIVSAIKEFYKKHQLDPMKMVMFTSIGASVMLGKPNGVVAQLKHDIPHLGDFRGMERDQADKRHRNLNEDHLHSVLSVIQEKMQISGNSGCF